MMKTAKQTPAAIAARLLKLIAAWWAKFVAPPAPPADGYGPR